MSNLKAIRDRIKSVKNTRKITEAMRLVAAAKVRRAQEQVTATRPFADSLAKVLYNLLNRLTLENIDLDLLKPRELKTIALVVISGDRGLCGGYNASVIKRAEQRANQLKAEGVGYKYVTVGRKATQYFERRSAPIDEKYIGLNQIPTASEASMIADHLSSLYQAEEIDRVELIYTKFVSLISSRPVIQTLFPLTYQELKIEVQDDEIFRLTSSGEDLKVTREIVATEVQTYPRDMIFEQDPVQIIEALLPLYINNQLLRALQESAASELAARMTAMNNASENASDLIKTLTLSYNKARQASITQQLLEVVAGANAT